MFIIYVTRPERAPQKLDPLLSQLSVSSFELLEADHRTAEADLLRNLGNIISDAENAGITSVFIILDAFLGIGEGRCEAGTQWNPNRSEIDSILELNEEGLLSLRLAWKIWAIAGDRARILVTTNGVKVNSRTRFALAQAFAEGRICRFYDWSASASECEHLVDLASSLVAAGEY